MSETKINDGGPAFFSPNCMTVGNTKNATGEVIATVECATRYSGTTMSVRTWLAGQALAGTYLSHWEDADFPILARRVVRIADATIKELGL